MFILTHLRKTFPNRTFWRNFLSHWRLWEKTREKEFVVRGNGRFVNGKWRSTERENSFFCVLLGATRITTGQFTGGFLLVKLWKIVVPASKETSKRKKRKKVKLLFEEIFLIYGINWLVSGEAIRLKSWKSERVKCYWQKAQVLSVMKDFFNFVMCHCWKLLRNWLLFERIKSQELNSNGAIVKC